MYRTKFAPTPKPSTKKTQESRGKIQPCTLFSPWPFHPCHGHSMLPFMFIRHRWLPFSRSRVRFLSTTAHFLCFHRTINQGFEKPRRPCSQTPAFRISCEPVVSSSHHIQEVRVCPRLAYTLLQPVQNNGAGKTYSTDDCSSTAVSGCTCSPAPHECCSVAASKIAAGSS